MIKEIKFFIFTIIILLFLFFTAKHYFSDSNKKKSYRSLSNIDDKINLYAESLPLLENDTKNIIEYVDGTQIKKKRKYKFWQLLDKND